MVSYEPTDRGFEVSLREMQCLSERPMEKKGHEGTVLIL